MLHIPNEIESHRSSASCIDFVMYSSKLLAFALNGIGNTLTAKHLLFKAMAYITMSLNRRQDAFSERKKKQFNSPGPFVNTRMIYFVYRSCLCGRPV